jgi:uncharacterized iron-regulated protein
MKTHGTLAGIVGSSLVLAGLAAWSGCGSMAPSDDDAGFTDTQIIDDYVDRVIVPTYTLLNVRFEALRSSIDAMAGGVTAENLAAAQQAWIDAREPWEQNEAFLFGPVSTGYDGALDNWPLSQGDLDGILTGTVELTPEFIALQDSNVKGFHAAEYLLFGEGSAKSAADFTNPRELEYLSLIADEMVQLSASLKSDWTVSYMDGDPYAEVFRSAGQGSRAYPSLESAAEEIVQGMIGICNEVANGKIATPVEEQRPDLIESHFSYNSLVDFQNNIRSVQNAYLGDDPAAGAAGLCEGDPACQGKGLNEFVASIDPAIDAELQAEIIAAIDAIGAIRAPFEEAITDPSQADVIAAAQDAVRQVEATLRDKVLPLITG